LKVEVDPDVLFDELIILQSTYADLKQYRQTISEQVRHFINPKLREEITADTSERTSDEDSSLDENEDDDDGGYFRKGNNESTLILTDWFWSFMFSKTTRKCEQFQRLVSYALSIPCSNAYVEGIFSQMKHCWTASRNLMSTELVSAELKIRLNSRISCTDFFEHILDQPDFLRNARSSQKYSFVKRRATTNN
jgi:hypothetical protein